MNNRKAKAATILAISLFQFPMIGNMLATEARFGGPNIWLLVFAYAIMTVFGGIAIWMIWEIFIGIDRAARKKSASISDDS